MPIKYNKNQGSDDYINNVPITEQISNQDSTEQKINDMLSNIIEEKQKLNNTSMIKMMSSLTSVTYYHIVPELSANNSIASDSSGPSDIGVETKKYQKIKNFLVKLDSGLSTSQEGEEDDKNYSASGTLTILPRTIKPMEGDHFIMSYYNKTYCWKIDSVETLSFESDTGFKCEYSIYKENYDFPDSCISQVYTYHHEFIGTTYRPILTLEEYETLKNAGKLYDHLSDVYNSLFYDKVINGYIFKDYDYEKSNKHFMDNNNINTLGRRGGVFRGSYDGEVYNIIDAPIKIRDEAKAYDNFINEFMLKNKVFRKFEGILLSVEPMLAIDRVGYKRSIYNCLEANTVAYFKNTSVSPIEIKLLQNGVCSYLVGKKNVIYHPENDDYNVHLPVKPGPHSHFFPQTLTDQLLNGKSLDMEVKCTGKVYSSIDNFIIETITRYVYNKTDDFIDRIKYLYEHIDSLYEHEISYNNIFYLFPLLGYVLEHSLRKIYSDNVEL